MSAFEERVVTSELYRNSHRDCVEAQSPFEWIQGRIWQSKKWAVNLIAAFLFR